MADSTPTFGRDEMRRWMANWRTVSEVQDELVRSAAPSDPVACLERGLSLIDFALRLRSASPPHDGRREAEAESVQQTWRRLRAAYGR